MVTFALAVYGVGWLITSMIIFATYDADIVDKIENFDDFVFETLRLLLSFLYGAFWPIIIPLGILWLIFGILYKIFIGIRWLVRCAFNKD